MSVENPLWGAPRIHGELLKLGFEVAQSSVAKYMVNRRGPPSQGWRTFLRPRPGVRILRIDPPRARIKEPVPPKEQKNCGEAVTPRLTG
jgi:hypothetical protein